MNQRRLILVIAVLTAGVAVLAWRAANAARSTEMTRHRLSERRAELERRLRKSETEPAGTTRSPVPPATAAAPESSVPPGETNGPRAANSLMEWLEDPKVQVLFLAHERANLAVSHGPFFQTQGLTAGEIERIKDLIVRSRANQHDLSELHRLQGRDLNAPEMRAQRDRDKAEIEAGLIAVLGEKRYARFQDYARALEVRVHVGEFAGTAAVEGVPLTRETADALVETLAAATPQFSLGGKAERSRIDWKKVETDVATLLTPAQLNLYQPSGGKKRAGQRSDAVWEALRRVRKEMAGETLSGKR